MKQILDETLEDIIIEKIERGLREVINEELGIATDVTILKNKIYNEIEEALKNTKSKLIKNRTIQNKQQVINSIQSILENIYHQTKTDKNFDSYEFHSIVETNTYSKDDYLRHLSNLLYMNNKSEIEEYANGLYAFVTKTENGGELDYNPMYFKSNAYKILQKIYKSKEFIELHYNDKEMDDTVNVYKDYGITKNNLPSIIDSTIKEMLRKFGKVLIKAKEDLLKSGWRSTSGKFYGF